MPRAASASVRSGRSSESSEDDAVGGAPEYRPGSEADYERLYRTSYRRILGTLITMLRDRAAAEDCTQDAFERAFKAWKTWRPDAPAEAWLHRIAINVAINGQRRERLQEVGAVLRRIGRPVEPTDPAVVVERTVASRLAAARARLQQLLEGTRPKKNG